MWRNSIMKCIAWISLGGLGLTSTARPASFDCSEAVKPLEHAICADPRLSKTDELLATAYRQTLHTVHGIWRHDLVQNQLKWLRYLSDGYEKKRSENIEEAKLHVWIGEQIEERLTQLREFRERDKVVYVQDTPEAEKVCSIALTKQNVIWQGRNDYGMDSYSLSLPSVFSLPDWVPLNGLASHAKFDFLNNGKRSDVYLVRFEGTHVTYTAYVLAAPNEQSRIVEGTSDPDSFIDLAKDLKRALPAGGHLPYSASRPRRTTPKLASWIVSPSETELYDGWYTRSQVVQYRHASYVIAESVNNAGGPTFTIFRPHGPGSLEALCYYRATPSVVNKSVIQLATQWKCPVGVRQIKTDLDKSPCSPNTAQIELKEWGGTRPVVQENGYVRPALCANQGVMVGDLGKASVESNTWAPINDLNDEQRSFLLTTEGPYIVAEHESATVYYRIANNSLTPVCSVSETPLVPNEYQHAN